MSYFVLASAPVLDLAALERECARSQVHPSAVLDTLMGVDQASRRQPASSEGADYALVSRDVALRRMRTQGHSEAAIAVAQDILQFADQVGLGRFFVPRRTGMRTLSLPSWVRHATTVTVITTAESSSGNESQEAVLRARSALLESIAQQKPLVEAHVHGFKQLLARVALSMGFGSAKEGWRNDSLAGEAIRELLPAIAFTIAFKSNEWHGGNGSNLVLSRSAAFIACVKESLPWMRADESEDVSLNDIAVSLETPTSDSPNTKELWHWMNAILPKDRQILQCPGESQVDAIVGSLFRVAIEKRRRTALEKSLEG